MQIVKTSSEHLTDNHMCTVCLATVSCLVCRDMDNGSDSGGSSDQSGSDEDGHQRKRRRPANESLGLFENDFFQEEFKKRRRVSLIHIRHFVYVILFYYYS